MTNNNNNILCIISESEINVSILSTIIRFARDNHAHINFLRIIDACKTSTTFFNIPVTTMKETLQSNLRTNLSLLAPDLLESEYSCHILEGVWFITAIQEAIVRQSSLIIIAEPSADIANFNSNAMHIIRKSPIPVWLAKRNISNEKLKILISLDIDLNEPSKKSANQKCFDLAKKIHLSSPKPSEILIAHCWSLPNEQYLKEITNNISINQINEMTKRERHFHEEWFHALCDKHEDLNLSHAYFIKGESQIEIPDLIKDEKINLLIMNTVDDVNTAGLYINSNAETILESTHDCSYLTVKPDGFVTPVSTKLQQRQDYEDLIT